MTSSADLDAPRAPVSTRPGIRVIHDGVASALERTSQYQLGRLVACLVLVVVAFIMPSDTHVSLRAIAMALLAVGLFSASVAVKRERRTRRIADEIWALADMGSDFEKARHPNAVNGALLDRLNRTYDFNRVAIITPLGGTQWSVRTQHLDNPVVLDFGATDVASHDVLLRRAWDERRPIHVDSIEGLNAPVLEAVMPFGMNMIVSPLIAGEDPLGVLILEAKRDAKVDEQLMKMVAEFSSHAALAFHNATLLAEIERVATVDGLTGLANRRVFDESLGGEVLRSERAGSSFSLVLLDIDNFKAVNDTYGHPAGDEVLRSVAATLTSVCRGMDLAARYGGEEIAVILPNCDELGATAAAERFREAVVISAGEIPVTVSAGVATYPINAIDADGLVQAADAALYQAKRSGKNRSQQFEGVVEATKQPEEDVRASRPS